MLKNELEMDLELQNLSEALNKSNRELDEVLNNNN